MNWREYEKQIYDQFKSKYSQHEILYDQTINGRYSLVPRQIDILIRYCLAGVESFGVFDCKCFSLNVDVKDIDSMLGFLDDVGASIGGIISTKGFSVGAVNRARAARIDLRVIPFTTVEELVAKFVPSLDFSDPRNSMYLGTLGT